MKHAVLAILLTTLIVMVFQHLMYGISAHAKSELMQEEKLSTVVRQIEQEGINKADLRMALGNRPSIAWTFFFSLIAVSIIIGIFCFWFCIMRRIWKP